MKMFKISLVLVSIIVLNSCVSQKKMLYFQDGKQQENVEEIQLFEPKIQIGDMLSINVSAMNGEAALPFNLFETPVMNGASSAMQRLDYLVDVEGDINFPVLGTIKVLGLTTKELTKSLKEQLIPYLKDPIINVRFANFKITVLGGVSNPGAISVPNERITIFEALGLAGDLDIQGNRRHVILMRESEGQRSFTNIDLTKKDLFNSPYYYLAQNDVLYVAPNKTKMNSSVVGPNISIIFSSISILMALTSFLIKF